MTPFPDTSFLCALYRSQVNSPLADARMAALTGPLIVSSLLLLEFRQSVRLQIWLNGNDSAKGFGRAEGEQMLRDLNTDLSAGVLVTRALDWTEVHHRAEALSGNHTATNGHRMTDILHVATALHLGAGEFLTFHQNQRQLAEAEGLVVPF